MAIIARETKTDYTPAPEGLHQAVCCDVVDLGMREGKWGPKHKVLVKWQLEAVNEEGKRFTVAQSYTLSLHQKALLRQHLESWRSRRFTEQELEGFDLENLISANCQVQIVHNVKDGTTYGNVQAIVPLGKGMPKLAVSKDYIRTIDRKDQNGSEKVAEPAEDLDPIPF